MRRLFSLTPLDKPQRYPGARRERHAIRLSTPHSQPSSFVAFAPLTLLRLLLLRLQGQTAAKQCCPLFLLAAQILLSQDL